MPPPSPWRCLYGSTTPTSPHWSTASPSPSRTRHPEPASPPPANTIDRVTEPAQHAPITGHADFIQLRHGRVHILDYKPNAKRCKPFAQLTAYALALTRRVPGLTLTDITCAWFDENAYYEFSPQAALRREP